MSFHRTMIACLTAKSLSEEQSTRNPFTCIRVRVKYQFFLKSMLQIICVSLTNSGDVSG